MSDNDNSVNIKDAKRAYHHGDLRAALVAEGLELLRNRTADDLSLREIARNVGVSATAVYRHFPDKQALLSALCNAGLEKLAERFKAARDDGGKGREGFDAVGRAYVRFALANPALFRLIMSNHGVAGSNIESPDRAEAFEMLINGIAEITPPATSDATRRIVAMQSWAIVHGLAMLMLDGMVPPDENLIEGVIRTPGISA